MLLNEFLKSHRKKVGRKLLIRVKDFSVPLIPVVTGHIREVQIVSTTKDYIGIKCNNREGITWYSKENFTETFELVEVL